MDETSKGIDLGSESHWVYAPTVDGKGREVKEFGATTPALEKMAAWLKARRGTHWRWSWSMRENWPVCQDEERQTGWIVSGFNGCTVAVCCGDPSGPKSRSTCCALWCGTKARWSPNGPIRFGGCRRAWTIRAIIAGERDADTLAKLRDPRCRQSVEQIAEQLSGHWREDHLFSLAQALKMHEAIEERIRRMKGRSSGNWRRWSARTAASRRHPSCGTVTKPS